MTTNDESTSYWQPVQTDDGWHLRLMGGNHEIVLVGENYSDPRSIQDAIDLAARTTEVAFLKDERTKKPDGN